MIRIVQILLLVMLTLKVSSQVSDSISVKKDCSAHFIKPSISFGTLVGGQFNSGGFYYKSGLGAHISFRNDVNRWLSVGIGGGIEKLQKEWLYPVYAEVVSEFSDSPATGFFILQTGYSFAYLSAYEAFEGYKGNGGFMISPGWGYSIRLKERTHFFFAAQFRQQSFRVEYQDDNGKDNSDRFSYSFLNLRAGIHF